MRGETISFPSVFEIFSLERMLQGRESRSGGSHATRIAERQVHQAEV